VGDHNLTNPAPDLLTATILKWHRRGWHVMWIGVRSTLRDFDAATLTAAATEATAMAADFYGAFPASAASEFLILIFGRKVPVFEGPQLLVTGRPGQFTATDTRDDSVLTAATLEDLVLAAGANPARAGDYGISWTQLASALHSGRSAQ
jgi:hypothetical protein